MSECTELRLEVVLQPPLLQLNSIHAVLQKSPKNCLQYTEVLAKDSVCWSPYVYFHFH